MSKPKNIDYSALDENNTRGQGFASPKPSAKQSEVNANYQDGTLAQCSESGLLEQANALTGALHQLDQATETLADSAVGPITYYLSGRALQDKLAQKLNVPKPSAVLGSLGPTPTVQLPELPGKKNQRLLGEG